MNAVSAPSCVLYLEQNGARRLIGMGWLLKDLAYGIRGLRKQPGFTAVAVVTLALGIGSATTIFSAIQNILLDPFPYVDAQSVVAIQIHDTSNSRPGGRNYFQAPEFLDFQEQSHVFSEVIGGTGDDVLWNSGDGMEQFTGRLRHAEHLPVSRRSGAAGPRHRAGGCAGRARRRYSSWRTRCGSSGSIGTRPSWAGRFTLNGTPTTLVGIMPQRFTKIGADLWMAKAMLTRRRSGNRAAIIWNFQAKLKPGVTAQQAQAEVEVIARRLAKVYPDNYPKNFSVQIHQLGGQPGRPVPDDAVHDRGGGGAAAADRVRQCREHAAGAGDRAREGDGGPRRRWARAGRG